MDTQDLVKDIKARFNINFQKEQLREKYTAKLIFADQGGLWTANPNLLSQLASSGATTLIILDNYENPIKVDRLKLLEKANDLYVSTMKDWHSEYETLKNNR